jgi:hypothetical protein
VRLKCCSSLLQTSKGQMLSCPQLVFVVALMDVAVSVPGARWAMVVSTAHAHAALLSNKAEGSQGSQPGEPLWGIWGELEFSILWTDNHIEALGPVFDHRKQRPCSFLRRMGTWP